MLFQFTENKGPSITKERSLISCGASKTDLSSNLTRRCLKAVVRGARLGPDQPFRPLCAASLEQWLHHHVLHDSVTRPWDQRNRAAFASRSLRADTSDLPYHTLSRGRSEVWSSMNGRNSAVAGATSAGPCHVFIC